MNRKNTMPNDDMAHHAAPATQMQRQAQAPSVLARWRSLSRLPFGRWLFSKLMGTVVPYAASIDARVQQLDVGLARVTLRDRRAVRNHLKSIHAVALTNLAELSANLALMSRELPGGGSRWIVTGMETAYLKKARGPITAETVLPPVDWSMPRELTGRVTLRDASNEVVMTASQRWKTGPGRLPA